MSILQPGPIIFRELLLPIRKPRMFLITTLYLLIIGIVFILMWKSFLESIQIFLPLELAKYGPKLIRVVFGFILTVFFFVPPFLTCRSISSELYNHTLESLLVTEIRPTKIIFTKLLSSLGFLHLYFILAIPIIGLAFIFGGISPQEIIQVIILIEAVGFFMGTIGLLVGIRLKKAYTSIIVSILVPLCFLLGHFFLVMNAIKHHFRPINQLMNSAMTLEFHETLNPIFTILHIFGNAANPPTSALYDQANNCALYHIIGGILVIVITSLLFRRVILSVYEPRSRTPHLERINSKARNQETSRKNKAPIFDWQNPVLMKEIRSRLFGKKEIIIRIVYLSIIISELFLVFISMSNVIIYWIWKGMSGMLLLFALLQIFVLSFFTIMVQSLLVPLEIENRTWDILRSTTLKYSKILSGKFLGGQWYSLLILLGSVPPLIIMGIISSSAGRVFWIICILAITMLNMGLTGFLIGINSKTTSQAINRALMVIIGIMLITVSIYCVNKYISPDIFMLPSVLVSINTLLNPYFIVKAGMGSALMFILLNSLVALILFFLILRSYKYRYDINIRLIGKEEIPEEEVPANVA